MTKIRLGTVEIKYISLFENLTGAKVRDCVQEENTLGFLVEKEDMGLAIGRGGSSIERVRKAVGKGVCVLEYSSDPQEFVENMFQQADIRRVSLHTVDKNRVAEVEVHRRDRSKIIGQGGSRIKMAKKLAKRHHDIEDIKIKTV